MVAVQWTPQFFNLENTISQDAYQIANAKFGVVSDTIELTFWAKNIFDKTYIQYAYAFGPSHLGNLETFGMTVMVKY